MIISTIIQEAKEAADIYNLKFVEIDRTDNIISLKLIIDNDLFIQIYGNAEKEKLNLTLVFRKKRLSGFDSEGSKCHFHPFDNPDIHTFTDNKKSIQEFVQESMTFLAEKGIL